MSFHYKKYYYTQEQNLKINITLQTYASNSTLKKMWETTLLRKKLIKNALYKNHYWIQYSNKLYVLKKILKILEVLLCTKTQ